MTEFKAFAPGSTEAFTRQFLAFLFAQQSRGLAVTGVFGTDGMQVTQTATASASVQVSSGMVVQQSSVTTGVSPMINNAGARTLDVLTASPMGALPRNDLVVFDSVTAQLAVVVGTPNASPTDPTPPNPSVPLARLRHNANATTVPNSRIDDLRVFTGLNTGVGSWQTYTPLMQTSGITVNMGSGSITGRYMDVGKTRFIHIEVVRAADSGVGNSTYTFSLPDGTYRSFRVSGSGHYYDASPFNEAPLTVRGIGAGTVVALTSSGARLSNTTVAWAANDEIVLDITIELA